MGVEIVPGEENGFGPKTYLISNDTSGSNRMYFSRNYDTSGVLDAWDNSAKYHLYMGHSATGITVGDDEMMALFTAWLNARAEYEADSPYLQPGGEAWV